MTSIYLVRLSSHKFDLDEKNLFVHLTNNAVQQYGDEFGKYEAGNMILFEEVEVAASD